jgi:hypothetical protein
MRSVYALVGFVCLVFGGSASAQTAVQACANASSGELKLLLSGGSCKPGLVALSLGSAAGDGRGPRVVDAADKDVGAFVSDGFSQNGFALRRDGSRWLAIHVDATGFVGTDMTAHYESTDCTGSVFLHAPDSVRLATTASMWNSLLRLSGPRTPSAVLQSVQSRNADGSVGTCFSGFSVTGELVGPEETIDPATLELTAPFRIVDE